MAGYLNKVQLMGNLGREPEVRHSQDGSKIVTFSLATTEFWRDKTTNERKDRTEWHRVVIFNERLADVAEKYLKKGSRVYLEGQLQTRKWTDNNGQEKYTTEVVIPRFRGELMLMDARNDDSPSASSFSQEPMAAAGGFGGGSAISSPSAGGSQGSSDNFDDEIPF